MSQAIADPQLTDTAPVDTGPQAVLELTQTGLTYRDVAKLLHISPSTVARKVSQARNEVQEQRRSLLHNAVLTYLVVLATVATAALSAIAWG
jgi:DNA-binding NarL/FixJ family response regulator